METGGQMSLSPPHRLPGELGSLAACAGLRGDACGGDTPSHGLNTEEQLGVTESQQVTAREERHRGSFRKACGWSQSCKYAQRACLENCRRAVWTADADSLAKAPEGTRIGKPEPRAWRLQPRCQVPRPSTAWGADRPGAWVRRLPAPLAPPL